MCLTYMRRAIIVILLISMKGYGQFFAAYI